MEVFIWILLPCGDAFFFVTIPDLIMALNSIVGTLRALPKVQFVCRRPLEGFVVIETTRQIFLRFLLELGVSFRI